jgi:hypothetical protein
MLGTVPVCNVHPHWKLGYSIDQNKAICPWTLFDPCCVAWGNFLVFTIQYCTTPAGHSQVYKADSYDTTILTFRDGEMCYLLQRSAQPAAHISDVNMSTLDDTA